MAEAGAERAPPDGGGEPGEPAIPGGHRIHTTPAGEAKVTRTFRMSMSAALKGTKLGKALKSEVRTLVHTVSQLVPFVGQVRSEVLSMVCPPPSSIRLNTH